MERNVYKNDLHPDAKVVVFGTLISMLVGGLTYLVGLGDEVQRFMCQFGEMPCKLAPALIPMLGFALTALKQYKTGTPKPEPEASVPTP